MFGYFNPRKRTPSHHQGPRPAVLLLAFALAAGNVGHLSSALAPPPETIAVYRMKVYPPESPLCVGRDYSVRVRISADHMYQGEDRLLHQLTSEGVTGSPIEAFVRNTGVATISPGRLITGWDVEEDAPGEVTFRVRAVKPGSTEVHFESLVPHANRMIQEPYLSEQLSIRVVQCKYKVTAYMQVSAHFPNLNSYMLSKAVGAMEIKTEDTYSGSAVVDWNASSFSALCSHSHTISPASAQLSGILSRNDWLTVQIKYGPAAFSSENCASSNAGVMEAAPLIVDVRASGGNVHREYAFTWGAMPMKGSISVYVTPIEAE